MYVRRAGVRQPAGARRAGGPDSAERTSPLYQNVRRASTALYVSCTCPVRLIMYINVVVQQQEMTRHRPHMGTAPDPRPPAARPRHAPAPGRTRIACDAHRSCHRTPRGPRTATFIDHRSHRGRAAVRPSTQMVCVTICSCVFAHALERTGHGPTATTSRSLHRTHAQDRARAHSSL